MVRAGQPGTEPLSQTGEEYAEQLEYVAAGRAKGRSLGSLRALAPFVRPFRFRIAAASLALVVSSGATLALPAALRGLIDKGFSTDQIQLISRYFGLLLLAAAVLGIATAIRF